MSINTSNPSSLQISGSSNQIDFNVLTNDFINAKITGNATVAGKVYHSWVGLIPDTNGDLVATTTVGTTTSNPAVSLNNVQFPTNAEVLIRKRCTHATYGALFEIVSLPGASASSNSAANEMCLATITSTQVDSRGFWQATAYTKDGTETWYVSGTAWWAVNTGNNVYTRPLVPVYIVGTRPQPSSSYTDSPRIVASPNWYMLPVMWPAILNNGAVGNQGPFKASFQLVQTTGPNLVQSPDTGPATYHGLVNDPGFILNIPYEGNQVWGSGPASSGLWPVNKIPSGRGIMGCFHGIGWIPVSGKPIWQGNIYAPIPTGTV